MVPEVPARFAEPWSAPVMCPRCFGWTDSYDVGNPDGVPFRDGAVCVCDACLYPAMFVVTGAGVFLRRLSVGEQWEHRVGVFQLRCLIIRQRLASWWARRV